MGLIAVVAVAGAAVLAGTLRAQEKEDSGTRVRVMAFGQGSYLGVYISDVSSDDVERLGLPGERGVLVTGVADEGPAHDAGLQKNDVILEWNGERVESQAQLRRILSETPAGRTATLSVFRDGSRRSVSVELGEREGFTMGSTWNEDASRQLREQLERSREKLGDVNVQLRRMPHVMTFMSMQGGRLGVGIQGLGAQLGDYFGLGDRTGVLVTTVREDSPAEAAGLKAGDVILAVGGEDVEGPGDLMKLVQEAEAGPVTIRILRDRAERSLTADLPESDWKWRSDEDGEMNGFFFGEPDAFQVEPGDVKVEWVEPELNLQRIELENLERMLPAAPVVIRSSVTAI